jgi:hypothetical protein
MNNKFDELSMGMAQSATRRQALKKFSIGIAGMALASFGLANRAEAGGCKGFGSACNPSNPITCCSGVCTFVLHYQKDGTVGPAGKWVCA